MGVKKTNYYSWCVKKLPKGCHFCVEGQKLVLFATGICSNACFYCPISASKKNKDTVYANEWKITSNEDIVKEAELCKAKGAGITGGDPFARLDKVIKYIKLLKKNFGSDFHVHLYAPLNLITSTRLNKLNKSGLDEIRFHPDLEDEKEWPKIKLAKKYKWDIGVEIPVLPYMEKQTKKLMNYVKDKIDFMVLNELEMSDSNFDQLLKKGLRTKNGVSYAVKGSDKLAKDLLKYGGKTKLNIHYCTAKLKDKIQLTKRIKRRAKSIAKPYDEISRCGTLIRGAIYLKSSVPGFGYRDKLLLIENRKSSIKKLIKIKRELQSQFNIPREFMEVDENKLRLLTATWILRKIAKKIRYKAAIVEEYPTWDQLEVELEFL